MQAKIPPAKFNDVPGVFWNYQGRMELGRHPGELSGGACRGARHYRLLDVGRRAAIQTQFLLAGLQRFPRGGEIGEAEVVY